MGMSFLEVQEIIDCLCGLSVHLIANSKDGILNMLHQEFQEEILTESAVDAFLRNFRVCQPGVLYVFSSTIPLRYIIYFDEGSSQYLVLGPYRDGSETANPGTLKNFLPQMPDEQKRKWIQDFCADQPVIPYEKMHRLAVMLIRHLFGQPAPIPFKKMDFHWGDAFIKEVLDAEPFEEVDRIRSVERRYEASAALTEAVKQGNLSLAYRYIQKMNHYADSIVRTPDALRNAKNLCIILNTQLRHAMEDVGIHPYQLDQLSGSIALQIEKYRTIAEVHSYWREIIRQYCELAQERDRKQLGNLVRLAVTFIKSHLSDNLTVKETAAILLVNPDYLSGQFHREMGVSFINYVNRERVRQAAALLQRTDMQIQQIASDVGYNNTSYFAKQFARFMGVSPREYREQCRRS